MGLADKTKYQVIMKLKDGEPLTSPRTWLSKDNAMEYLKNSLDQGYFAWAALIKLDINSALVGVEEYYVS